MISDEEAKKLKDNIKELEKALENEKREKETINKEFEETKKDFEKANKDFEKIKKDYEETKKEFEEFKSKHALTVSNLKKALKIKADAKKSAKLLGAPNGHKGYARHIPERIDYIKQLNHKKFPH